MEKDNYIKAKKHLLNVIENSKKSYTSLMVDLENQLEKWKGEYNCLSDINIFDLTHGQYERKNYLDALIENSEVLLSRATIETNKKT